MDIEQARTFLAIVETGTFIRAAEQRNVTQSTVSARVKALEGQLGCSLFQRSKAGATLTSAGTRFARCAEIMVRAWQQTRQEIGLTAKYSAMIRIGGQFTLWDRLLLKWIPWMRSALPELAIRAEVGLSEGLMRQLGEGLLDIGVMYTPQTRPNLIIDHLMDERLVLVSSNPESRAPWEDEYVYIDWGPEFRLSHGDAFPGLPASALYVSHGPLGLQYVVENGGSGYFPMRLVRSHLVDKRLLRVPGAPTFSRPVYAVHAIADKDEPFRTALEGLRRVVALEPEE